MKKLGLGPKIYLALIVLLLYLPIWVVALFSFNASTARTPTVFTGFSLQWYRALFSDERGFGEALKNSQGLIENIAVLPTMLPEIILGVAFLLLFSALGLPSGMLTLTLAHTTFCMPYVYLLVKSRLATMGDEMENAARDLGATPLRALLTVTLPLLRPAVFSGALLALAMSLDDFVISFFVSGAGGSTLPLKIYSSARYGVSAQINALCTVMLAAVFLLVGLSQWALRKKR